jgi:hypothetical protein
MFFIAFPFFLWGEYPIDTTSRSISSLSATQLGAHVIKNAVQKAGIKLTDVEEVFFGNVLSAKYVLAVTHVSRLLNSLLMEDVFIQSRPEPFPSMRHWRGIA